MRGEAARSCTAKKLDLNVGCLAGVFRATGAEKNPLNLNQVMLAEEVRDGKGASSHEQQKWVSGFAVRECDNFRKLSAPLTFFPLT